MGDSAAASSLDSGVVMYEPEDLVANADGLDEYSEVAAISSTMPAVIMAEPLGQQHVANGHVTKELAGQSYTGDSEELILMALYSSFTYNSRTCMPLSGSSG